MEAYSWTITEKNIALKNIDKSVYVSNETGIPEEIRYYWEIESMEPGDEKTITVCFKDGTYLFGIKRAQMPTPYRTRMHWHKDFAEALSGVLDYEEWMKEEDAYSMAFEKMGTNLYKLTLIKVIA